MIETIIPHAPADVAPMRAAFARTVSTQWERYVPDALGPPGQSISDSQFAKGRFIGEMYARACYSMLLVSGRGPITLSVPIRAAAVLPLSRRWTIRLGSTLLVCMKHLLPDAIHRQLLLMSALMGVLDVVLDGTASTGQAAALHVASLFVRPAPTEVLAAEQMIVALVQAARQSETAWQGEYWQRVLQPAVREYCQAEVLAVEQMSDPTGMGHRWAGLEAAIKGMWYVIGPRMGLQGDLCRFEQRQWNREQRWMADTSLLMQIIDDWVDQDDDCGARLTAVVAGEWTLESVAGLYRKTMRDLTALLDEGGIRNPVLKDLLVDLYTDYLQAAISAMDSGLAA